MSRIGSNFEGNIRPIQMLDAEASAAHRDSDDPSCEAGLAPGTQVLTLDGVIPVEFLNPGDRVLTRNGARTLQSIVRHILPEGTQRIRVASDALGGKPTGETILMPSQRVLIRDWRAKAIWGKDVAAVPIARLVDGTAIRTETEGRQTMLSLYLGSPEILYADGLELASADPVEVPAPTKAG